MSDDLLGIYDSQLRGESEVLGCRSWDQQGPVWRATYGDSGIVSYRSLEGIDATALHSLVAASVEHFAAMPQLTSFEWKTRSHDVTDGLEALLIEAGFVPDEVETVMLGEAEALVAAAPQTPPGIVVRRVDQLADRVVLLHAAADMQAGVFGRGGGGEELVERVDRSGGTTEVWVAEADGVIVSAGRLEIVAGTQCAGLWGGATLPAWRGRGIYRLLTAARAESAMTRGVRYLHSDCTDMSRPILERSGLRKVTTSTPYVWTRPSPAAPAIG